MFGASDTPIEDVLHCARPAMVTQIITRVTEL